jgi:hypothetical protein
MCVLLGCTNDRLHHFGPSRPKVTPAGLPKGDREAFQVDGRQAAADGTGGVLKLSDLKKRDAAARSGNTLPKGDPSGIA